MALTYPYLTAAEARMDEGYRRLAERVADSYVELTILAPGELAPGERPGIIHVASGIVVRPGLVLTAAHIARSTQHRAQVRTRDGRRFDARILHLAPKRELALLAVDRGAGLLPATLGPDAPPAKDDFVLAIGSPGGRAGSVSLGTVRSPDINERLDYNDWGFDHAIELSMEVESGHSGGPVFDRSGAVIGMIAGYELGDTTKTPYVSPRIAYAVPARDIERYLDERLGQ